MTEVPPIMIWRYEDIPKQWKKACSCCAEGGWVAIIPDHSSYDNVPWVKVCRTGVDLSSNITFREKSGTLYVVGNE